MNCGITSAARAARRTSPAGIGAVPARPCFSRQTDTQLKVRARHPHSADPTPPAVLPTVCSLTTPLPAPRRETGGGAASARGCSTLLGGLAARVRGMSAEVLTYRVRAAPSRMLTTLATTAPAPPDGKVVRS